MKRTKPDWAERAVANVQATFMKHYLHRDDVMKLLHAERRWVVRMVRQLRNKQCRKQVATCARCYCEACDDLLAALRGKE